MGKEPKFAVDVMLGRLATWLRIIGYDAFYSNSIDTGNIWRLALAENRILLTRNRKLSGRAMPGVKTVYIKYDKLWDQVRQAKKELRLDTKKAYSRCSVCNEPLQEIEKEKVKDKVPSYVYTTVNEFSFCQGCGRYYWPGTHLPEIEKKFRELTF